MFSPVFHFELIRSGRNRWHWWLRILYASVLLFFLFTVYNGHAVQTLKGSGANIRAMKTVAATFYGQFQICQLVTVILLAPVFAANSISEEKSRRTLEHLLSTPMRDAEIVGSKLLLAVVRVWEILLAGLPFCALCLLLGGLSPLQVIGDFIIAMATAWICCCFASLCAVWTKRLADALLVVILVQAIWYTTPLALMFLSFGGATFANVPSFVTNLNPFWSMNQTASPDPYAPWTTMFVELSPALGAWIGFGLAFAVVAWWRLRKSWDVSQYVTASWLLKLINAKLGFYRRKETLPLLTDDPMSWRELQQRRSNFFERIAWAVVILALATLLVVCVSYFETDQQSIISNTPGPPPIMAILSVLTAFLYLGMFAMPVIGIIGATAFTEERDRGLFDLLRTTDLTQYEIVSAKATRLIRAVFLLVSVHAAALLASCLIGYTPFATVLTLTSHTLAAGVFFAMFGLYTGLQIKKTSHCVLIVIAVSALLDWVFPIALTSMTRGPNVDALLLVLSLSPSFHSVVQITIDNIPRPDPHALPIWLCRVVTIFVAFMYVLIAVRFYRRCADHPIGPWLHSADVVSDSVLAQMISKNAPSPFATAPVK